MFELKTTTECTLTKFVGRVQKSVPDDVPAVSIYLKITGAPNTMLDMLSPSVRRGLYAPIEGQEDLPGVEASTPVLRSPDVKTWKSDVVHEGWKLFIARGIGADEEGLQMGSCKADNFTFDLYQGGTVDCEFRISTADVDEDGAGMLWGRQQRKVFVQLHAPELPKGDKTEATGAEIDGSKGHPGAADRQGSLLDDEAQTPEGALAAAVGEGGDPGEGDPDEHGEEDDGSGHPDGDDGAREQAELEAGITGSLKAAGVKARRAAKVH